MLKVDVEKVGDIFWESMLRLRKWEKVWRWDGYKKVWESMLKVEDEKVGSTVIPLSI
jgi:hypothetical protein